MTAPHVVPCTCDDSVPATANCCLRLLTAALSMANPFAALVQDQRFFTLDHVTLESGETLSQVPVAYKLWGRLNAAGTNCMLICHALTGLADVGDWWGPLLGPGLAFDPRHFFVVCCNLLGLPYGLALPVTLNPATGEHYGPDFPVVSVRDDVAIHRRVLEALGVKQIAAVIGGLMGGMLVLEWAMLAREYVRCIVALATLARHSAWCILWGEAQRQCIYSDPKYLDGWYAADDPPAAGLGAARMLALLTYRLRNLFESRFGRERPTEQHHRKRDSVRSASVQSDSLEGHAPSENSRIHNDGHRHLQQPAEAASRPPHAFTAQTYLRYQGDKFVLRFDANCYISITRKLDTHDLARGRPEFKGLLAAAVRLIVQPALVIGVASDGLFTYQEQQFLARNIPNALLYRIESPEGHDAFLLEFQEIQEQVVGFLRKEIADCYESEVEGWEETMASLWTGSSVFGEAEDVTNW